MESIQGFSPRISEPDSLLSERAILDALRRDAVSPSSESDTVNADLLPFWPDHIFPPIKDLKTWEHEHLLKCAVKE